MRSLLKSSTDLLESETLCGEHKLGHDNFTLMDLRQNLQPTNQIIRGIYYDVRGISFN